MTSRELQYILSQSDSMTTAMRSVLTKAAGGVEQLFIGSTPIPNIQRSEVLIRAYAAGVNRLDLMQRQGKYPIPEGASTVMGVEVSGIIEKSLSPKYKPGDRVMALISGGGYAEYVACHADLCMRIPKNLDFCQAAAIPEQWITAFQLLNWIGKLQAGENVLIHAAASGVGLAAIQLCKYGKANAIIATSRTAEKLEACKQLGATACVNTKNTPKFSEAVLKATDGRGVNLVLDCIGGDYFDENLKSCALDARYVLYALMGGPKANANLARIVMQQVKVLPTRLRHRTLEYRSNLIQDFHAVIPKFEDGTFTAPIDTVYNLEDVQLAHKRMESNENTGKIILQILDQASS